MLKFIAHRLEEVFGLFYPNICLTCSENLLTNESIVCTRCAGRLPQYNHWHTPNNKLMMRFAGRVDVQAAAAYLQFTRLSPTQHLIHALKYHSRQDVGEYLGRSLAYKLMAPESIFKNIDVIVPVPLHWKKQQTRGYNQCDSFAKGLSEMMQVPWTADALVRNHENVSQTKKKRYDRFGNVEQIFGIKDESLLRGKHVLLVDDVVTTGATSEACMHTILAVPDTKVSFAAIAMAVRK